MKHVYILLLILLGLISCTNESTTNENTDRVYIEQLFDGDGSEVVVDGEEDDDITGADGKSSVKFTNNMDRTLVLNLPGASVTIQPGQTITRSKDPSDLYYFNLSSSSSVNSSNKQKFYTDGYLLYNKVLIRYVQNSGSQTPNEYVFSYFTLNTIGFHNNKNPKLTWNNLGSPVTSYTIYRVIGNNPNDPYSPRETVSGSTSSYIDQWLFKPGHPQAQPGYTQAWYYVQAKAGTQTMNSGALWVKVSLPGSNFEPEF